MGINYNLESCFWEVEGNVIFINYLTNIWDENRYTHDCTHQLKMTGMVTDDSL